MNTYSFDWDEQKNAENIKKHGVSFEEAQEAFFDSLKIIAEDVKHSHFEERLYCLGKVKEEILTVRFTYRERTIRIIGAGYWRKGRKFYEKQNSIH